jgi:FKBP-type peptidyl-prolyl cis-trans isomerase SlyD
MIIQAPCVVSLTWQLADGQNRPIDELTEPTEFFYGGDDLLAKVEEALAGYEAGAELSLHLEPEHAFGDYQPALVCFEPRALFPTELQTGMAFEGLPEGAATPNMPADAIYLVTEIYPSHVVLDGNHPLAGMALRIQIKVVAVRAASDEEIEARTVGDTALTVMASANRAANGHLH